MHNKLSYNLYVKKAIFVLPLLLCFFIQLTKINTDILSFSEVWWILTPFRFIEPMQGGHTPYYYYLVKFFQIFNVFDVAPLIYLRFINCLFNVAALVYIYKTFKAIFDERIAFLTILCLSLGSFFLGTTVTSIRYPLVNLLFFFTIYNFLMYLRFRSNLYFSLFFLGGLIATSLDAHVAFGLLFMAMYMLFYKAPADRKLIIAGILIGINIIVTNSLIYIVAKPFIKSHIGWLALKNNFNYFIVEFTPNFFFNTLDLKFHILMWIAFSILFCLFIFILSKIHDRRVIVIVLFIASCFLLLGAVQYVTKLQFFIVKYFIFLIPFMLSLFFYVIPGRKKILAYLFCAFVGYNTLVSYPAICASNYSYIFRAIDKYKPTVCLSLNGTGFVPETILKTLYPSIQIERVQTINNDSSYTAKTLLLVSSHNSRDFDGNSVEILNAPLRGYAKVLEYYFEYCPGYTCVYLIYARLD